MGKYFHLFGLSTKTAKKIITIFCAVFAFYNQPAASEENIISLPLNQIINQPINNFKSLRDKDIVKQNFDFSCGAAALATLLNSFYGLNLSEEIILKAMHKENYRASFEDLQKVLPQFGFKGQGYAISFEQLTKLKIPVIIYVKYRNDEHFSVLRGIDSHTAWLADPSLGNRTFSRNQFLEMWETVKVDQVDGIPKGKILIVLPNNRDIQARQHFFSKSPVRQTKQLAENISITRF